MEKIVISASRRTDIPAHYMSWFMDQVSKGFFEVINPYNNRTNTIVADPEKIHTIVFWSKNYGHFIKEGFDRKLENSGFQFYFNFTINSENPILEPNIPPLSERFKQLKYLAEIYTPRAVTWRFDPICFYKTNKNDTRNNLDDFTLIADYAAKCGIKRCITSFMDNYPKIGKRVNLIPGFKFIEPGIDKKIEVLTRMEKQLNSRRMNLFTCCEKEIINALPADSQVKSSSCIPNDILIDLYGDGISIKKDMGQRIKQGCGCKISKDIGTYNLHPCFNNCLYCYANPDSLVKV